MFRFPFHLLALLVLACVLSPSRAAAQDVACDESMRHTFQCRAFFPLTDQDRLECGIDPASMNAEFRCRLRLRGELVARRRDARADCEVPEAPFAIPDGLLDVLCEGAVRVAGGRTVLEIALNDQFATLVSEADLDAERYLTIVWRTWREINPVGDTAEFFDSVSGIHLATVRGAEPPPEIVWRR